jgi:hypothetical protein
MSAPGLKYDLDRPGDSRQSKSLMRGDEPWTSVPLHGTGGRQKDPLDWNELEAEHRNFVDGEGKLWARLL